MAEPNTKKILFNKSTLLSLKAELIKKQEEVKEKKRLPQHKLENFKPPPSQPVIKSAKSEKKTFKDSLKAVDVEELEAFRKSKSALEKKTELYEHLSDNAGESVLSGRFLVDFSSKKQQEPERPPTPELPDPPNIGAVDVNYNDDDDNGDWMEYTDCLGRTRQLLRSDLELYKKRDQQLLRVMNKEKGIDPTIQAAAEDEPTTEQASEVSTEKPLLVQTTKDYLQTLRDKWEEKEKELLAKDGDIHYQDVLFDEARLHGVSYFSFSTDEKERQKQMEELNRTRQETLKAQQDAQEKRKKRDELIAARVAAARARQRMRAGLPPEDPEEKKNDFTTCLLEFLNQQKNEADAKAKEEEKKLKEEKEKEREKLRQAYVRDWDIGKEGVGASKKERFREMSQEEYVELQRSKRIEEFAPLPTTSNYHSDKHFDDRGNFIEPESSQLQKTWQDVRPENNRRDSLQLEEEPTIGGLYFTSSKQRVKEVRYKNFVPANEPSLIVNELSDEEVEEIKTSTKKRKAHHHVEVPPPPTFDYYGPSGKYTRTEVPFTSDVQEAYAQGVKVLEKKEGKAKLSDKYDFLI